MTDAAKDFSMQLTERLEGVEDRLLVVRGLVEAELELEVGKILVVLQDALAALGEAIEAIGSDTSPWSRPGGQGCSTPGEAHQ